MRGEEGEKRRGEKRRGEKRRGEEREERRGEEREERGKRRGQRGDPHLSNDPRHVRRERRSAAAAVGRYEDHLLRVGERRCDVPCQLGQLVHDEGHDCGLCVVGVGVAVRVVMRINRSITQSLHQSLNHSTNHSLTPPITHLSVRLEGVGLGLEDLSLGLSWGGRGEGRRERWIGR